MAPGCQPSWPDVSVKYCGFFVSLLSLCPLHQLICRKVYLILYFWSSDMYVRVKQNRNKHYYLCNRHTKVYNLHLLWGKNMKFFPLRRMLQDLASSPHHLLDRIRFIRDLKRISALLTYWPCVFLCTITRHLQIHVIITEKAHNAYT